MRTLALSLLLSFVAAAAQDDLGTLVKRLGDDDLDIRDAAAAELLKRGEAARAALEKAAADGENAERKARARAILDQLNRRREAELIKVEVIVSTEAPTRWDVNSGAFKLTIRFTNGNDHEVVVPVTGELRIFEKDGSEVSTAMHWGGGTSIRGCMLPVYAGETFRTLPPKKSADVTTGLDKVRQSLGSAGYRIESPGDYTFVVTPGFSRDAFLKRCGQACAVHADEKQPWNRATVLPATAAKGTITIGKGASIACDTHAKLPGERAVDHAAWCHLEGEKCASCGNSPGGSCWKDRHKEPHPTVPMCANCARAKGVCAACGK